MSLHIQTQTLMADLSNKVPAEMMVKVGAFIERLAKHGIIASAKKTGQPAPDFALWSTSGNRVGLSALRARGPVVLSFYRGEWCPFCDLELRAYQKALPELQQLGATLAAISPQPLERSRSTVENRNLEFDVLSDPDNTTARAYGLTFSMTDAEQALHTTFGADLPKINAGDNWDLPAPVTYIVDQGGLIVWGHVDGNYTRRAEPADVIAALRKLQQRH